MITDTPMLRPIDGTFAAEALDIELTRPLDAGALAWIEPCTSARSVRSFDFNPNEKRLGTPE